MSKSLNRQDSKDSLVVRLLTVVSLFLLFGLLSSKSFAETHVRCQIRTSLKLSDSERQTLMAKSYVLRPETDMNFTPADGDLQLSQDHKAQTYKLQSYVAPSANIQAQWILLWNASLGRTSQAKLVADIPSCDHIFELRRWQGYFQIMGPAARVRLNRSYDSHAAVPGLTQMVTQAEAMIQYGPSGKAYEQALSFYRHQLNSISEEVKAAVIAGPGIEFEDKLNEARKVFVKHLENYCSDIAHPYLLSSIWGPSKCVNCVGQALMITSVLNDSDILKNPKWRLGIQIFEDHIQAVYWNQESKEVIEILTGTKLKRVRASIYEPEVISYAMALRSGTASDQERETGLRFKFIDFFEQSPRAAIMALAGIHRSSGDWSDMPYGYLRWNRGLSVYNPVTPPSRSKVQYQEIHDEFKQQEMAQPVTERLTQKGTEEPMDQSTEDSLIAAMGDAAARQAEKDSRESQVLQALKEIESKDRLEKQFQSLVLARNLNGKMTPEEIKALASSLKSHAGQVQRALRSRCRDNCNSYIDMPQMRVARKDESSKFLPGMNVFTENPIPKETPAEDTFDITTYVINPRYALVFRSEEDRLKFLVSSLEEQIDSFMGPALAKAKLLANSEALSSLPKTLSDFGQVAYAKEEKIREQIKTLSLFSLYMELAEQLDSGIFYRKNWEEKYYSGVFYPSQFGIELLAQFSDAGAKLLSSNSAFSNMDVLEDERILKAFASYAQVTHALDEKKWATVHRVAAKEFGTLVQEKLADSATLGPQVGILRRLLLDKAEVELSESKSQVVKILAMVESDKKPDRTEYRFELYKPEQKVNFKHKLPTVWFAGLFLSLPMEILKHPLVQWTAYKHWTPKLQTLFREKLKSSYQNEIRFTTLWSWSPFLSYGFIEPITSEREWTEYTRIKGSYLQMAWRPSAQRVIDIPLPDPSQKIPDFIKEDLEAALRKRLDFPVQYTWSEQSGISGWEPNSPNVHHSNIADRLGTLAFRIGDIDEYNPGNARLMPSGAYEEGHLPGRPDLTFTWDDFYFDLRSYLYETGVPEASRIAVRVYDSLETAEKVRFEMLSDGNQGRSLILQMNFEIPGNNRVVDIGYGAAG